MNRGAPVACRPQHKAGGAATVLSGERPVRPPPPPAWPRSPSPASWTSARRSGAAAQRSASRLAEEANATLDFATRPQPRPDTQRAIQRTRWQPRACRWPSWGRRRRSAPTLLHILASSTAIRRPAIRPQADSRRVFGGPLAPASAHRAGYDRWSIESGLPAVSATERTRNRAATRRLEAQQSSSCAPHRRLGSHRPIRRRTVTVKPAGAGEAP